MGRRLLSLCCSLLIAFLAIGVSPSARMVCRFSGEVMAALPAGRGPACCQVRASANAPGGVRLVAPGCCDLKSSPEAPPAPGLVPAPQEAPVAVLAPSGAPRPTGGALLDLPRAAATLKPFAPRGPPPGAVSPRGPPALS